MKNKPEKSTKTVQMNVSLVDNNNRPLTTILKALPDYFDFINEGYKYCKALSFAKGAETLIDGSDFKYDTKDVGLVVESKDNLTADFINAMKGHRNWERMQGKG